MKKIRLSLLALAIVMLLAGCGKEYIYEFDENYQGEWHSTDQIISDGGLELEMVMTINGQFGDYGWLCLKLCGCECGLNSTGKARISNDHTKLYFGLSNGGVHAVKPIDEAPHLNAAGQWECTIEGYKMVRR